MPMTDCDKFSDKLTLYFEGELSTEERKEIHHHLETCTECPAKIESWRSIHKQVRALTKVTTSPAFESKLHARIREIRQPEPRGVRWEKWRVPALVAVGATALFMIILFTPSELKTPQIQVSQKKETGAINVTGSTPAQIKTPTVNRERLLRSLQASRGISLDSAAQKLLEDSLRDVYNRQIKTVKEQE